MGKYNFTAQKWAEIEQRLEALEQANNELRKENAMLRSQAKDKSLDRLLSRDIGNYDKAVALFAVPDDKTTGNNFATFYRNIFRALNPKVSTFKDGETRVTYIGTHDVTDAEYRIYCETLEAVIDTIYYAKKKMKGDADNAGTDLTVG